MKKINFTEKLENLTLKRRNLWENQNLWVIKYIVL